MKDSSALISAQLPNFHPMPTESITILNSNTFIIIYIYKKHPKWHFASEIILKIDNINNI